MHRDWIITVLIFVCAYLFAMRLWGWLSVPKGSKCLHLLIITPKTKNIEQLIHWNRLCLSLDFMLGIGRLLLIDMGSEEQQKKVIERILKRYSHIGVCDFNDIENLISKENYNQIRIIF